MSFWDLGASIALALGRPVGPFANEPSATATLVSPEAVTASAALGAQGEAESRVANAPYPAQDPLPAGQTPPPNQIPPPRTGEPTGFGPPAARDGRLPEAQPGLPRALRVLKSERMWREGDVLKVRGIVHAQFRGYDIFANEIDGNVVTNVFILRGNVQLIGRDAAVVGETVEVDFEAETFRAIDAVTEVRPEYFQGMTLSNLYLRGGEVWGSEREVFGHDCDLTTCTYDKPHYELSSRDLNLRTGKRLILRNVKLNVLGRTLFNIPYLSIPLDERRNSYSPEVGRTPEEGYFIKTKWAVPVGGPNDLDAYADYFEKLGLGVGGRFRYLSAASEGFLRLYGIFGDSDTVEAQAGHRQLFGRNQLQVDTNYQQRNYLNAPQNTLTNVRALYTMPGAVRGDTMRLSYNRTNNRSSSFESTSQTFSINDLRTLWGDLRTKMDVAWVRSESSFASGSSEREQVNVQFQGTKDLRRALAELEYQRSIPVGEATNFFSASDRTPVLTFKTNHQRLFGTSQRPALNLDALEVSQGEFVDAQARDQVSRTNFDIRASYNGNLGRRASVTMNSRFRQSFYSDDTAQYAVGYSADARYPMGHDTAFSLRYNYLEREGFTPLAIDRVGKSNLATADLSFRPARSLLLGVQTGYDYLVEERGDLPSAWQPLGVRVDWRPREWFNARVLPVYDPVRQVWSQVRFDLTYLPGATYVALGARYDGFRQTWGQASVVVDNLKWGRTKFSSILTYNGYLRKFEERHYSVTYDLHCAEAVLQMRESNFGFRSGREIYFFVRIKAFPFDTPFGLTRRGAPIGTATGRGF